jgi:hypothetical protein
MEEYTFHWRDWAAGKTVGVTANSHKVIRHFLDGVFKAAETSGVDIRAIQKPGEMEPNQARLRFAKSNDDLLKAIANDSNVAGGDCMALVAARCRRHRGSALRR